MDDVARLWAFSTDVYGRPGVEASCLKLQARYGLSISLLLGAIWLGLEGRGRLGTSDVEAAVRRAQEWDREVIDPLRALRRHLKLTPPRGVEDETHSLRNQLMDAELAAEQVQQRLLLADFPGSTASPPGEHWRDAAWNAGMVVRRKCPRRDPEAVSAIARILHEACDHLETEAAVREVEQVWPDGATHSIPHDAGSHTPH